MTRYSICPILAAALVGAGNAGAVMPAEQAAHIFGTRPNILSAAVSPDGKKVVMLGTGGARARIVYVVDLADNKPKMIRYSDDQIRFTYCGWSSNDRIVCGLRLSRNSINAVRVGYSRMVSMNTDGQDLKELSARNRGFTQRASQFSGSVIDWMDGSTPDVLMIRDHVPEESTNHLVAKTEDGFGVDRVDTRTLRSVNVEHANRNASDFITDGQGHVRIMALEATGSYGMLQGSTEYLYRLSGDRTWRAFSRVPYVDYNDALRPLSVDGTANIAYALRKTDGRDALYRVSLDGALKAELAYANPQVDVDNVVTIGRRGRVIGVTYMADRRLTNYFDPAYQKLSQSISKALTSLPLVTFESASADESVLVLRASSDVDGGHFYILERATHHLSELLPVRPELEGVKTAPVTSISYPAGDGTMVPAYLTLPVDQPQRGLPAIVMPHGGPAARDEWGFDWLAQFFAARGYAVIQPEFRGSTGFGDAWYVQNGFKSWKTAIKDVTAAGEWLVKQGIADPAKLAIVGWSYGGYAALQSNVVDPGLFKAVVAIAPVTDLRMLRAESDNFTNSSVEKSYIGEGPHLIEGSPRAHADAFRAPVIMFHGVNDLNVSIAESEAMDAALRSAGKSSTLVRYPELDHQLDDSEARIDMLTKADAFLRAAMKM